MYTNYFYFDIETTSKFPTLFDYKLDDVRGANLFVKKAENFRKFDPEWSGELNDVFINKAPLLPEYGRIICMSFGMFKDDELKTGVIVDLDEKELLKRMVRVFSRAADLKRTYAGFNIKSFDLPFIIKKLYKYGIDVPMCLNYRTSKPWEIIMVDLMEIWRGTGRYGSSLQEVAYELNIAEPDTSITGADVFDLYWNKKDINTVTKKCENDVITSIEIAKILKI
jgi:hypothetical protein